MSDREKQAAEEVVKVIVGIPVDAEDYVRGYIQGRLDALKKDAKEGR